MHPQAYLAADLRQSWGGPGPALGRLADWGSLDEGSRCWQSWAALRAAPAAGEGLPRCPKVADRTAAAAHGSLTAQEGLCQNTPLLVLRPQAMHAMGLRKGFKLSPLVLTF